MLERTIADEPERTWQLVRRAAARPTTGSRSTPSPTSSARASSTSRTAGRSSSSSSTRPSRWERRLVGSTVATTPFVDHAAAASRSSPRTAWPHRQLIGDDEPDVQKALAWALRSLVLVDAAPWRRFCDEQAAIAPATTTATAPGSSATPSPSSRRPRRAITARLDGIRRRAGAPATSVAAAAADASARACSAGRSPNLR
jgi:hypothetical protein